MSREYEYIRYDREEDIEIPNEHDESMDIPPEKEIKVERINFHNHSGL